MDLKIVKEENKKNMIERNISTEQLAKILDIKIRSLQTYMSKNGKIPVSILKKMAKNNFFDVKNIVNTEFSDIEKKIKNKKEELEKLDYELYLKKLEYEKLENLELLARPRFSSTGFYGKLIKDRDKIYFKYNEENAHNAKGQHIVFFYDNFVVGGGEIK